MDTLQSRLITLGTGAALMYFLDPERGRRRRAKARDQLARARHVAVDGLGATGRDLRYRTAGVLARAGSECRYRIAGERVSDVVLVERVRSRIGRAVTHPSEIEVTADRGRVTLTGPVLASEVHELLAAVRGVHGVRGVENRLQARRQPGHMPGLQGAGRARSRRPGPLQRNWSPATRTAAAAGGAALALYGLGRGGATGLAAGAAGTALLARGATNMELARLLGLQGRRGVDVHKTVNVKTPVDEVYEFWSHFENFPRFMSHVLDVRDLGAGRSHWVVAGPAGTPVRWQAVVTRVVPNEVLAWKSVDGSAVGHAGIVHFHENPDRSTQIDIELTYNPPVGALGHAVAAFFGSDPKTAMDADLVRLKSLLEDGKTTAHGREVTLAEVGRAAPAPASSPRDPVRATGDLDANELDVEQQLRAWAA